MIEVEIKVKISDPDKMREKFVKNGGKYTKSLHHEDTYFNMPKGLRNFRETDEALRVRKSTEFHIDRKEPANDPRYFITYKGKKIDTITKSRREMEVEIEDGDTMREIFRNLGFREVFTVKKERKLFDFIHKGNKIEALIDYLPRLDQHFIEVEYLTDSEEKISEARDFLFDFLKLLDINKEESITKSYLELIADSLVKK